MRRPGQHAIVARYVFDGETLLRDHAVVVEEARIVAVVPRVDLPGAMGRETVPPGAWLAPGFIDTQVNGGGDVLFNDEPTVEGIAAISAAHRRFGTTALLPTLITDTPGKMRAALDAVEASAKRNPSVIGIHWEGPFLSPEKPGVHSPSLIRPPTEEDTTLLTRQGNGVRLVTLAPEEAPPGFVARLVTSGARVSLGHSMATYAQTKAALAEGLTGFTHLFNAMRPLGGREPGPIAAALEAPNAWVGLIVDGEHVAPPMLRLALRGRANPMLVTDAMPPVGGRNPTFTLYGEPISARDGRCLRADGTLAGAALDMAGAVRNCVRLLGVPLTDALRFASTQPARFLGLGDRLGRLAPGYRADMVALAPETLGIFATWVAGSKSAPSAD